MPDSENTNLIRGNILVCRELISPYSNETRYQLAYGKGWSINNKTLQEFEELCENLNILEIIGANGPLDLNITDFDNLTSEEKASIKVITLPNSTSLQSNSNEKGIIDPSVELTLKNINETDFNDLKKMDNDFEENVDDINTILVLPLTIYETIFGDMDELNSDDYLEYTEEDFFDNTTQEFNYHIVDILRNSGEDKSYLSILDNITTEDQYNLQRFKTHESDVVRLFIRNEEKFQSDLEELYDQLSLLNDQHGQYLLHKNEIETALENCASSLYAINTEIAEYESSHERLPEGVSEGIPYFSYEFLNDDEKEEYSTLIDQLHELLNNQATLNTNLSEN